MLGIDILRFGSQELADLHVFLRGGGVDALRQYQRYGQYIVNHGEFLTLNTAQAGQVSVKMNGIIELANGMRPGKSSCRHCFKAVSDDNLTSISVPVEDASPWCCEPDPAADPCRWRAAA